MVVGGGWCCKKKKYCNKHFSFTQVARSRLLSLLLSETLYFAFFFFSFFCKRCEVKFVYFFFGFAAVEEQAYQANYKKQNNKKKLSDLQQFALLNAHAHSTVGLFKPLVSILFQSCFCHSKKIFSRSYTKRVALQKCAKKCAQLSKNIDILSLLYTSTYMLLIR